MLAISVDPKADTPRAVGNFLRGHNLVDHSAFVSGISAKGALTTIYPADFKPADLVHDTPLPLDR